MAIAESIFYQELLAMGIIANMPDLRKRTGIYKSVLAKALTESYIHEYRHPLPLTLADVGSALDTVDDLEHSLGWNDMVGDKVPITKRTLHEYARQLEHVAAADRAKLARFAEKVWTRYDAEIKEMGRFRLSLK